MAGRPKANRTTIVPAERIIADIRVERWTIGRLYGELVDPEASMSWLASRRLLSNTRTCSKCNNLCKLQNYQHGIDGKRWACEPCGFRKSIREGSFFLKAIYP